MAVSSGAFGSCRNALRDAGWCRMLVWWWWVWGYGWKNWKKQLEVWQTGQFFLDVDNFQVLFGTFLSALGRSVFITKGVNSLDPHQGSRYSSPWMLQSQETLQKATDAERCQLAMELTGHVWQAAKSACANYVLQKFIQVLRCLELRSWRFHARKNIFVTIPYCLFIKGE